MNSLSEDIQDLYDNKGPAEYGAEYERQRWFKHPVAEAGFHMTKFAVERILSKREFSNCFELGPGAGTWTKHICAKNQEAQLTLLDISEKMLEMARLNLADKCQHIEFVRSDFLEFYPTEKFEFFFSSRVIEYIEDKPAMVKKINDILALEGSGAVITKYPRYWAAKLRGRKVSKIHQHQISPSEFSKLLAGAGLEVTAVRPVILTFPFLNSATLNRITHMALGWLPLCFLNKPFCESYLIEFKK